VMVAFLFFLALVLNKFILIGALAFIAIVFLFFIKRNKKNILILTLLLLLASGFVMSVDYGFEHLLEKHQKTRINVLLSKEVDPKGAGYNINQSKIAIGSGGFSGKGFLKGTQTKYNFVPEQSTDFIFCTVGEEYGFLGSLFVIVLYVSLLVRIVIVAERQRSKFSRIYGYGVASIIFFHFAINIGMTIGLSPVIGIPLPYFSYGGSSLLAFTLLLFVFIKQDAYRYNLL
jgi:rod shape determining protein RodA